MTSTDRRGIVCTFQTMAFSSVNDAGTAGSCGTENEEGDIFNVGSDEDDDDSADFADDAGAKMTTMTATSSPTAKRQAWRLRRLRTVTLKYILKRGSQRMEAIRFESAKMVLRLPIRSSWSWRGQARNHQLPHTQARKGRTVLRKDIPDPRRTGSATAAQI